MKPADVEVDIQGVADDPRVKNMRFAVAESTDDSGIPMLYCPELAKPSDPDYDFMIYSIRPKFKAAKPYKVKVIFPPGSVCEGFLELLDDDVIRLHSEVFRYLRESAVYRWLWEINTEPADDGQVRAS